jgi:hypothetical protein
MVDPRAAVGNFIWSWMVYGFKGVRYVVSAHYRARVHEFWRVHPGRRSRGIWQMILGGSWIWSLWQVLRWRSFLTNNC